MFNPLRPLKYLPWTELMQVALITIGFTILLDWLLFQVAAIPALRSMIVQLLESPLAVIVFLGAAVGVGALAVAITERWFRRIVITNAILWALVPCLLFGFWLRSLLPDAVFPQLLTPGVNFNSAMGMIIGLFWKGKPYWR
ncbi:peptide chain release factor 1 [Leptolyngbya sp. FACHB-17]|uniref:peptide chain release factor 1 n=1 Tax=unclassified Leptolyngbya TaxID=2650499 RepID=UPI00168043C7|nr:peptide chain release factor 1 [Leptolyngbya sp. FACHB-17]MBD2081480.1 peptide chain release factor 1 [Leptolyngbya sp. FACHB-17]